MKPRERFWGLHFDFHADNHHVIGMHTDIENIEKYLEAANPDFIQCDVKGHYGYSSYPTQVGIPADRIQEDNLRIWCEAAHRHGIPIYAHYSSLIDTAYGEKHPEECVLDENGEPIRSGGNNLIIGFHGKYVDELMIPQIMELITEYHMDGIWIDGDCWAVRRDYSPSALASLPCVMGKEEYSDYTRMLYSRYLNHVIDEIHAFAPDFHIMSNWAFSSYMPEPVFCNLDSLSGDLTSVKSVASARYEGRCLAAQSKPWDLMTWGFAGLSPNNAMEEEKPTQQLCQEAAAVLALGGGFQIYNMQDSSGAVRQTDLRRIRETSEFVRKRHENYAKPSFSQTAVYYSKTARYRISNHVYTPSGSTNALNAAVQAVLDTQYTADILMEYQLDRLNNYEIVTVPEWVGMGETADRALLDYAENGGNLVIMGANAGAHFGELIGKNFKVSAVPEMKSVFDEKTGCFARTCSVFADLESGAEPLYSTNDLRDRDIPAYRTEHYGKGTLTLIPFDFASNYAKRRSFHWMRFLKRIYAALARPVIEINRPDIDLTMQKAENGIFVNLINMRENRRDMIFNVYDEVPPVEQVEILIHTGHTRVRSLYGDPVEWENTPNGLKVRIPFLHIHIALEIS